MISHFERPALHLQAHDFLQSSKEVVSSLPFIGNEDITAAYWARGRDMDVEWHLQSREIILTRNV
jgi:hypothetical protein